MACQTQRYTALVQGPQRCALQRLVWRGAGSSFSTYQIELMIDPAKKDDELAGTEQPFVQHLVELRDRLLHALYGIGVVLVALLLYPGPSRLYDLLALPLVQALPEGSRMIAVGVVSPFLVPIKVSVLAALALSLPWILYQVWSFVAPGLYKHEKKLVLPLVAASTVLFYAGAAFCYFFVFGQAFPAIQKMAPMSVAVSPDIEAYLDFVITMFIAFGVAFEVPIVVVILARMGVVTIAQLKAFRTYFVVGAAAVAGLVTPPDPVSMIALLVPMVLLYELGILAAQLFIRHTAAPDEDS
jgi:sec-independent protein translocase protein TatC